MRGERRLKMKARRRSPVMLAFSLLTALGQAPSAWAATRRGEQRREARVAAGRLVTAPADSGRTSGWSEVGAVRIGPPVPSVAPEPARPEPEVAVLARTGWQRGVYSTGLWEGRSGSVFSADLGLTVLGDDGNRWGGCVTGFWYGGDRRNLALKVVRRWRLDDAPGAFFQLSPGLLVAGDDAEVDLHPGAVVEAELGNTWFGVTTGVQLQPWTRRAVDGSTDDELEVTWTFGARSHPAVAAATVMVLYLALVIAFASGGAGFD